VTYVLHFCYYVQWFNLSSDWFAVTLPGNAFIFVHLDHHVLWQVNELRSMATGALDAVAHDIPSHDLYQEIHLTVIGWYLGSLISLQFCLEFKYHNYDKGPLAIPACLDQVPLS